MTQGLAEQLTTVSDRIFLLRELDGVRKSFFSVGASAGTVNLSTLGIRSRSLAFWSDLISSGVLTVKTIDELRKEIESYRIIRVSVAFEPDQLYLEKVIAVFRKKMGQASYLLDIEIVDHISAGVIYSMDGKIVDCSLEKKLKAIDMQSITNSFLPVLSS